MTVLLGIATATSQVGVALGGPDGPMASLHVRQGRRHGELLTPAIETLMRMAGIGTREIDRVAVDIGPGLFTGLRVGVATAKALAAALEIPIVGCSSLDLLAHPHRREGRLVAAVVDAKRGEVFWALYRATTDGMVPVTDATVSAPDALIEALQLRSRGPGHPPALAVGDGARRYSELLTAPNVVEVAGPIDDHPSATILVELAATRPSVPLDEITPRYLRGADVRIGWQERPAPSEPTSPEPTDAVAGHG